MNTRCGILAGMKRAFFLLAALAACGAAAETAELADGAGWYAGAGGAVMLPGHGQTLRRAAAVTVQAGRYMTDAWALEVAGACVPHAVSSRGGTTVETLAVRGLFHLSGWETFDKLFGCERFDPFVTCGAAASFSSRAAFADGRRRTAMGPTAGFGFFWHLTESWSVRADATACLAVDDGCGLVYAAGIGLQRLFGGGS